MNDDPTSPVPTEPAPKVWELRLYVAGQTPKCLAAFANLKKLCEEHLAGRYRIQVIDLENPHREGDDFRHPDLVRLPEPVRQIIGDRPIRSVSWLDCNFVPAKQKDHSMTEPPAEDGGATERFEQMASRPNEERYVLRLYISGLTPRSTEALATLRALCEEHLQGRYQLEVIDLFQHPELAEGDEIIATPTLIKELPAPLRRLVGDLSDVERVLVGLNLRKRE